MNLFLYLSFLFNRLSSVDISHIQGNLEEISTFQQMLVQSLDDQTKSVYLFLSLSAKFLYLLLNKS